jgi:hypothetical protein
MIPINYTKILVKIKFLVKAPNVILTVALLIIVKKTNKNNFTVLSHWRILSRPTYCLFFLAFLADRELVNAAPAGGNDPKDCTVFVCTAESAITLATCSSSKI